MRILKFSAAALFLIYAAGFALFASPAGAQPAPADPVVVTNPAGDTTTVTTTPAGDDTTVINTPADQPTTVETGDNTTVVLPVGSWVEQFTAAFRDLAITALGLVLLWASRLLPEGIRQYINAERIKAAEQLLGKAVDAGFNAVKGATKGKVVEINVGSSLVAAGAQYAVDNGPAALIKWLGGPEGVKEKVAARLDLGADLTTKAVLAGAPPVVGKR